MAYLVNTKTIQRLMDIVHYYFVKFEVRAEFLKFEASGKKGILNVSGIDDCKTIAEVSAAYLYSIF